MVQTEVKNFGFNPQAEAEYLLRLAPEKRKGVLEWEIATAVGEANRFTFTNFYTVTPEGKIFDERSGEPLKNVVERGGRREETTAIGIVEEGLKNDRLVIHFSPANETYHYPKGVVDLWSKEGTQVYWRRLTVENSFEELREIYSGLKGENISDELEMLSKPVFLEKTEEAPVLARFRRVEEKIKVTQEEIAQVTRSILDYFEKQFGEGFVVDAEKIFRGFSAVMQELPNYLKEKVTDSVRRAKEAASRFFTYTFAPMIETVVGTFGCDFQTRIGSFGQRIGGFFSGLLNGLREVTGKYFDCPKCGGKILSGRGIEQCPHCGARKDDYRKCG